MMDSNKIIDLKNYQNVRSIGKGGFSKVFLIKELTTKKFYAAKVLNIQIEAEEEEEENKDILFIYREIKLFSSLNHPSILKFIGYSPTDFNKKRHPTIITEFAPNGSLKDIIKLELAGLSPNGWNDTRKLINIYGIAAGLLHLHSNNIIHRDIKPENVLMDDYLFPKIADFGLSKPTDSIFQSVDIQSQSGYKGTPSYMAPEIFEDELYSFASDVYAFSLIVYEIVTGITPFSGLNMNKLMRKVSILGERPELTPDISNAYQELINRCWAQNRDERPKFEEIIEDLKNNKDFITETIDEAEYYNYIDYIDEYKSSFDLDHSIHYKDLMTKKGRNTQIEKVALNELAKITEEEPQKITEEDEETEPIQQHLTSYTSSFKNKVTIVSNNRMEELDERTIYVPFEKVRSCFPVYSSRNLSNENENPNIILDIGTDTTKVGFNFFSRPLFIPSIISYKHDPESETPELDEYDFFIGDEALNSHKSLYERGEIIKNGEINWDNAERFLEHVFFKSLNCDPEDYYLSVIDQYKSLNYDSDNCLYDHKFYESIFEIMYETFNCPYLYLHNPYLATLSGSWSNKYRSAGCAVHLGENSTEVATIVDGYIQCKSIRVLPFGGSDITKFISDELKERETSIPPDDLMKTARFAKEKLCKLCMHNSATFAKLDLSPDKYIAKATAFSSSTGQNFTYEVGHERFMAPEIYFSPEIIRDDHTRSLPHIIYDSIFSSPIEKRKDVFGFIALSGASSNIKGFAPRLQHELQKLIDENSNKSSIHFYASIREHKRQSFTEWHSSASFVTNNFIIKNSINRNEYFEKGIEAFLEKEKGKYLVSTSNN